MKIKMSELSGAALDWAVAKVEGYTPLYPAMPHQMLRTPDGLLSHMCEIHFSTDWAQGGPIIEREGISLRPIVRPGHALHGQFLAAIDHGNTGTMVQWVKRESFSRHYWKGPAALIAAMRCFVASKLGDEVDVPEELLA